MVGLRMNNYLYALNQRTSFHNLRALKVLREKNMSIEQRNGSSLQRSALVVYGTRWGGTVAIAERISYVLKKDGYVTAIADVKNNPDRGATFYFTIPVDIKDV